VTFIVPVSVEQGVLNGDFSDASRLKGDGDKVHVTAIEGKTIHCLTSHPENLQMKNCHLNVLNTSIPF
jgi:hypothetical protein